MSTDRPQKSAPQSRSRFRGRMAFNLTAWLLPITLLPLLLMGWLTFSNARELILTEVSDQMETYLIQTMGHMDSWFLDKNLELNRLAQNQDFITLTQSLVRYRPSSTSFQLAQDDARTLLRTLNPVGMSALFNQFFFVNPNGDILVSNTRAWEGLTLSGQAYFTEKIIKEDSISVLTVAPAPMYSDTEDTQHRIALITSWAVNDSQGSLLGYIIGISDPNYLYDILVTDSSFLPENKLFLITESDEYIGVVDLLKTGSITTVNPSSGQRSLVNAGPTQGEIASSFQSYDDEEVLGVYEYYPSLNVGIIVEVPQETFLGGIDALTPFSIILVGITAMAISAGIFLFSRRFTNPLRELSTTTRQFAEGDWQRRSEIQRTDEIGLLAFTFNQMADELSQMYRSMELQVDERTRQVITAAEVASLATSAPNLEELLNQTVNLITERFGHYQASIFLLDDAGENAILRTATGSVGLSLTAQEYHIPINANSIVGWVSQNNTPRVVSDVEQENLYLKHELLPDTHSEISIPISIGTTVLGVLDVQSKDPNAFESSSADVLITLANQLASALQNFRLLEGAEIDLQQISELYRASRQIAQAENPREILQSSSNAIQQSAFLSAIYVPERNSLHLVETPDQQVSYAHQLPKTLNISPQQAQTYLGDRPILIRDVTQPAASIHTELLAMPDQLNCQTAALLPILQDNVLSGVMIIGSRERGTITQTSIQPFASLIELITTALAKVSAIETTHKSLQENLILSDFSVKISNVTDSNQLYGLIHQEITNILGDVDFYIAIYDSDTDFIQIPYNFEGEQLVRVEPFPLGEGLASIVLRTRQPLMLVENAEERARALGAKGIDHSAKSWLGVPIVVRGEVIGVISVQDSQNEHRFSDQDLTLLSTLATPIAGAIHSARLLEETQKRAYQLETASEVARETSATLDRDTLLRSAVNLVRDRFDFYHASVFLLDPLGEYAIIQESTGEAGRQMIQDKHRLAVGSQSVVGYAAQNRQPLVVNDITQDPTHRFNPLLPDTRAEIGIPISVGDRLLGVLDAQSTVPYAFSPDDIEVLQILADQLAIAIANAELFTETQEHLAQHRLIHHVTTVAASSSGIEDALSSAVQGLRVTLGDRVAILLQDAHTNLLRVVASSGYDDELLSLRIEVGQGITGWVAEHREPLLVNDVLNDPRYIPGNDAVRSELAVPLLYRNEMLGILNIESDNYNAFDDHDQDILGTLAGSLAAIIVNARLTERQRQLLEITNKIRRSVNVETILETTANELTRALRTRKTRIQVGGETIADRSPLPAGENGSPNPNGDEDQVMNEEGTDD